MEEIIKISIKSWKTGINMGKTWKIYENLSKYVQIIQNVYKYTICGKYVYSCIYIYIYTKTEEMCINC